MPPARRLSGGSLVAAAALIACVGCQSAAPTAPTTAPASAPTVAPTVAKPAASAVTSPAASPASSPSAAASPLAAASPKPAASPAASPSAAIALPSPSAAAVVGQIVNFSATDYSYSLPDTISAGQVTLVMRNQGQAPHHAQFMKLNTGVSFDQFAAALQQGEGPAFQLVSFKGGTGALDPGSPTVTEQVTVNLDPGNYVVACFISDPDGVPHFAKGMVKPLQVTAAQAGATAQQPSAQIDITLRDFAFDTPSGPLPSGRNTWHLTNTGPQPHELQVAKLAPGGSAQQVLQFFTTPPSGPPPYQSVGGFQAIDANGSGWLTLDLAAGEYAFYCAIPDPTNGKRHLEEGMLTQVTLR